MEKIMAQDWSYPRKNELAENPSAHLVTRKNFLGSGLTASEKVLYLTKKAMEWAELFDNKHPYWNGIANCYLRVHDRCKVLSESFPGITKVIHNSDVKVGDILVSDFHTGLNYGYMKGGFAPVKIRVLEVGNVVKGVVLRNDGEEAGETGQFNNELWFFISHKFTIVSKNC